MRVAGRRRTIVDMSEHEPPPAGLSRRQLIAGLGAATGAAGLLAGLPGGAVVAGPVTPALAGRPARLPQVLQPPSADLSYVGIDSFGFSTPNNDRYSDDTSGTGALMPPDWVVAPLSIPAGSVVKEINVAYIGTPGVQLWRRRLATPQEGGPTPPAAVFSEMAPDQGGGPQAHTFTTDLTIAADSTYSLRMPIDVGESIFGVTIGYESPAAAAGALGLVPIDPPTRPLDTRQPGPQTGKLQASEERIVDLVDLPAGAAGAVINLTITGTETDFGYVSVYRAGIPWPGNSSINWSSPELTAANGVITAVDDQGRIAIRGGEAATHVVIDLVGALV